MLRHWERRKWNSSEDQTFSERNEQSEDVYAKELPKLFFLKVTEGGESALPSLACSPQRLEDNKAPFVEAAALFAGD